MLERSDHEQLSPTLGDSSEEDSHRLHAYTVTENERVLIAEFPLERQDDNDCLRHAGSLHRVRAFWVRGAGLSMKRETRNSGARVLTILGAKNVTQPLTVLLSYYFEASVPL
jgi:hypothetical protein